MLYTIDGKTYNSQGSEDLNENKALLQYQLFLFLYSIGLLIPCRLIFMTPSTCRWSMFPVPSYKKRRKLLPWRYIMILPVISRVLFRTTPISCLLFLLWNLMLRPRKRLRRKDRRWRWRRWWFLRRTDTIAIWIISFVLPRMSLLICIIQLFIKLHLFFLFLLCSKTKQTHIKQKI